MLKKYVNGFCLDGEGVIEKNAELGVREINLFTSQPLQAESKMKKSALKGSIIVSWELYKQFKGKTQIPLRVYVDLYNEEEKVLDEISLANVPVAIPLFDNLTRTGLINAKYELSPAKFIEQMGFLDRDCLIIGGMYADKDDLSLMGQYGAKIVVCPRAYSRKGSTFANIVLMQKQGLKVLLGTYDEEVNFEKEKEYLHLTTLSLLEDDNAVTDADIERIARGE